MTACRLRPAVFRTTLRYLVIPRILAHGRTIGLVLRRRVGQLVFVHRQEILCVDGCTNGVSTRAHRRQLARGKRVPSVITERQSIDCGNHLVVVLERRLARLAQNIIRRAYAQEIVDFSSRKVSFLVIDLRKIKASTLEWTKVFSFSRGGGGSPSARKFLSTSQARPVLVMINMTFSR